jgi:putative molybdenum carrier protein
MRILSGGQTGVDRGALDAAIASHIDYGGWCPKGGWAEDAPTPPGLLGKYPHLRETPSGDPRQRTAWNVRDADAVLALRRGPAISAGTDLAVALATQCGKPWLCLDLDNPASLGRALAWLSMEPPLRALNIVGPRESETPGIYTVSRRFIVDLLAPNV